MLPTLTVQLDNSTGTFPFDITSKVLLADGHEISRGREDWQGAVTAGEVTLTLNNSDGRFTPGSTILATPSPIVLDQRIRVRETINGVTYTRFTGYLKSIPVEWPGVVPSIAFVRLTATDAQARAERRPLRSLLEEDILTDAPNAYYRLSEPAEATSAGDISGKQAPALGPLGTGTAVVFGNGIGPGTDGLTAAQFAGGQYLGTADPTVYAYLGGGSTWSVGLWVYAAAPPAATAALWTMGSLGATVNSVGQVIFYVIGPNICDGRTHQVVVTYNDPTVTMYVDGVSVGTSSQAGLSGGLSSLFLASGGPGSPLSNFAGTMSHFATYSTTLASGHVASAYAMGTSQTESDTARITRIAGYAGLTLGTLDSSLTTVPAQATTDKSAMEALQEVTDAGMGVLFVDETGALEFHNRNRVVAKTAPDLILSTQYVTPDVVPVTDDERLINYMQVTSESTGTAQLVTSATSESTHGRYDASQTYLVTTDQEALARGQWIVGNFAEPTNRYGTLTINLFNMSPALASQVLNAVEIDCWLRVTSMAGQNPGGTTTDVVVQGWRETVNADTWQITCNVVAQSLYTPVWTLDVSALDVNTRLYV